MKNELHVNFCIFNFTESVEEITGIMGCPPSKAWLKGGKYNERHPNLKATHSRWVLNSGLELNSSFEEHLESLLNALENVKENLKTILKNYESGIVVAAYYYETNPGFSMPNKLLKRMAQLGVGINFDLYYLGDKEE